jgi:HD-GYP domain-containing protein (c-di-GMP phosphodiesterase class II)
MAIDAKDRYTCGHSARVSFLASLMAGELFHEPEMIETYRIAGLVHDVGKIGVPEAVLCKSGKLTDEEFAHIQRHPTVGFEILRDIPMLDKVLPGVLHHHERWDGRGYPARLKEEAIPPIARVLAVCDTFDALSSTRSYRPARPRSEALAEIKRAAGSQLEPTAVEAFLRLDLSAYDAMVADHAGAWIDRSTQAA